MPELSSEFSKFMMPLREPFWVEVESEQLTKSKNKKEKRKNRKVLLNFILFLQVSFSINYTFSSHFDNFS
jgi:hypothetical protein